jgi:hypothetical protein
MDEAVHRLAKLFSSGAARPTRIQMPGRPARSAFVQLAVQESYEHFIGKMGFHMELKVHGNP